MQLILIRHGETINNKLNDVNRSIYIGQYDSGLTEKGVLQAKALQNNEIFENVDKYYCSNLLRAKKTLSYFFQEDNVIYDSRLNERSLGVFEGHQVDEIKEKYPQYFTNKELVNFAHGFTAKAPNGENYNDVCQRVEEFLSELKKQNYQKVVIVSHFCTIRCIEKIVNNLSQQETLNLKIYPCQPIIIEY